MRIVPCTPAYPSHDLNPTQPAMCWLEGAGDFHLPEYQLHRPPSTPQSFPSRPLPCPMPLGPPRAALIRVWRPPGDLEEVAREGAVLLVTQLQPSSSAGGGMADLGCGRLRWGGQQSGLEWRTFGRG